MSSPSGAIHQWRHLSLCQCTMLHNIWFTLRHVEINGNVVSLAPVCRLQSLIFNY